MTKTIFLWMFVALMSVKAWPDATLQSRQNQTPQNETIQSGAVSWMTTDFPLSTAMPALDLSQVIKRHPDKKKFKVCWEYAVGGGSGSGHAIYDRTRRTLRFFSTTTDADHYKMEKHDLYSNVTDGVLHRLAQDVGNREKPGMKVSNKNCYFDHLCAYGCRWRGQQREWDLSR